MTMARYYIDIRLADPIGKINSFDLPLVADIDEMRNVHIHGCQFNKEFDLSEYGGSNIEWLTEWANREWSGERLLKAGKIEIEEKLLT